MIYPVLVLSRESEHTQFTFEKEIYINCIPRVGEFIELGKLDGTHKVMNVLYTPFPYGDTKIEIMCIKGKN